MHRSISGRSVTIQCMTSELYVLYVVNVPERSAFPTQNTTMKIVLVLAVCLVAVWGETCNKNDLVGTCDHTKCLGDYVVSCDLERQCVCHQPTAAGKPCGSVSDCTADCHEGNLPHFRDHCINGKCSCGFGLDNLGGLGGIGK